MTTTIMPRARIDRPLRVNLMVSLDEKARWREAALGDGTTLSEWLRRIVRERIAADATARAMKVAS
jgi:hypothetical protein